MDEIRIILENVANDTSDTVISENNLLKQEHVNGIAIGVSFGIIIFTFLITLVVYWLLIKFNASREGMNRLILCLISMAVGALLGDSVLNLIPEIYSTHYDSYGVKRDKGDPTVSSTIIISSYLAYFILEKIVKVLRNNKQQYQFEPEEDKNKSNENIPKEEIVSDNKEFPENGNFSII